MTATPEPPPFHRAGNQIIGASLPASHEELTNASVEGNPVPSGLTPSPEYLTFWGEGVSESWFDSKKCLSPVPIIYILFTCLTLYLCVKLLFSPGEVEELVHSSAYDAELKKAEKSGEINDAAKK